MYDYFSLERGQPDATLETMLQARHVLGVEVTIPAIAQYCDVGNIDHHGPGATAETPSACEQALIIKLPPKEAILMTVYPDADSVTAMAVLANRAAGYPVDESIVKMVAEYDKLGPSVGRPADLLIAISRISTTKSWSMAERVKWIQGVLQGAVNPVLVQKLVADHDRDFEAAAAATSIELRFDGRVAVVTSTHRYATRIGYSHAPVLVCVNPEFPIELKNVAAGSYLKYTICRYNRFVSFDLPRVLTDLLHLESAWGGRADIIGSPINTSSQLTLEEVLAVVEKHLG